MIVNALTKDNCGWIKAYLVEGTGEKRKTIIYVDKDEMNEKYLAIGHGVRLGDGKASVDESRWGVTQKEFDWATGILMRENLLKDKKDLHNRII